MRGHAPFRLALSLALAALVAPVAAAARPPDLGGRLRIGVTWMNDLDDHTSDPRGPAEGPGLCVSGTFERAGVFETSAAVGFTRLRYGDLEGVPASDVGHGTRVDLRLEGRIGPAAGRVRPWFGYGLGAAWVRLPAYAVPTPVGTRTGETTSGWTLGPDVGVGLDLGPPAGTGGFVEARLMPDLFGPGKAVMKPLTFRAGVRLP
jgi:hypothetical protein